MSTFINLLSSNKKENELIGVIQSLRLGEELDIVFDRPIESFSAIEDSAFLYSIPHPLLSLAAKGNTLLSLGVSARQGIGASTKFHRLWWEVPVACHSYDRQAWPFMAHGTPFSPFYKPSLFCFKWGKDGREAKADVLHRYPYLGKNYGFKIQAEDFYFLPGLCYGKRTENFSVQVMPSNHVFSFEGTAIHATESGLSYWALLALLNSSPVRFWLSKVCAQHKAYNYVQKIPVPESLDDRLGELAKDGWKLAWRKDTINEVSNAFILPLALRRRIDIPYPDDFKRRISELLEEIDNIVVGLYGLSKQDCEALSHQGRKQSEIARLSHAADDSSEVEDPETREGLLSWAVGVVFGRFDWRLATGEREPPPEPDPFDPLPAKSPAMLPSGVEPRNRHAGILVEDPGNEYDLPRLIVDLLETVNVQVDDDLRRWLRRDFFKYHLQQYSKSRRKAPIYWPLATASGSYTLWLYYLDLTDQTLFTAVNDFVDPKLKQLESDLEGLRDQGGSRSRADEKRLEELSDFYDELVDLRDTMLNIAPDYKPDQEDGVQITAAPLWPLFRHKPWQNALKDTWEKLEKGDFDWAHLAMAYWPERVREKCVTDKSLAIAHDLEHLYQEPES